MTAINLATVFAPTLLGDDGAKEKVVKRKERRASQDNLSKSVQEVTSLKIAALQLMIEHANWIGLSPHCYVTSIHHHRSSSAAPSPRPPFLVDRSSPKGKPSLDRTTSVNVDQPGRTKDSPAVFPPNETLSDASRSRYVLEFHDSPAAADDSEHSKMATVDRQAASSSRLRGSLEGGNWAERKCRAVCVSVPTSAFILTMRDIAVLLIETVGKLRVRTKALENTPSVPLQAFLGEKINRCSISETGDSLESPNIDDDVFSSLNDMKPAILNAKTNEELLVMLSDVNSSDRGFRVRQSIAFIEKQGIVRKRVNMFKQLENSMSVPLESMSAQSSGLSSRSSLDVGDKKFVKPSAPPVTHSLDMGDPGRNSNNVSSHQPGISLQSPK
ncbi:hypothetical protein KIN20_015390 [Parelaphostrongylus tenuis]|uniref:Rho-GAP domain-containing protein n=1 Tax=Parelaphostrongylus tenuis TaxID=148309 RepID=A0AAD5MET2_PARTN|nr:hypothetical protein KIN20_015390 [Parelaphostrongylus tenuis]